MTVNWECGKRRRFRAEQSHSTVQPRSPTITVFPGLRAFFVEDKSLFLPLLAFLLFPIAVYCAILGMINRRAQPLVVSGAWDFAGVVLATSGFLLVLGPALITGVFQQSLHDLPLHHESMSIGGALGEVLAAWWILWLLYYLFVLGGAAFLIWMRRDSTVIYNIDAQMLDNAISAAARRLGLQTQRRGNRLEFGPVESGTKTVDGGQWTVDGGVTSHSPTVQQPPSTVHHPPSSIEVEMFPLLSNVTLHWHCATPESRADLERELRKSLAEVYTLDNTVGSWLLGIAALFFLVIALLTAIFVVTVMMLARNY
jgi:hypothetical protein